jgi:hypothetical protein
MRGIPSERYLLIQRAFTFFDEWLFYVVLLLLFFSGHYRTCGAVLFAGGIFIGYSYVRLWEMEEMRFGPEKNKPQKE